MYKLILLPSNWPFHSENPKIITSNLTKEEAETIISDIQKGEIERCLKTESENKGDYNGYKSQ